MKAGESGCNRVFDELRKLRKPGRFRLAVAKFVDLVDNRFLGVAIQIVVRLFAAVAAVLSLYDDEKVLATALLIVLALVEAIGLVGRKFRRRERFRECVERCQRFVDALFAYLLARASDFRVTVLLSKRDGDHLFLVPIVRNSECSLDRARRLLIDDNGGTHQGVAGAAWKLGHGHSRSAPKNSDGVVEHASEKYKAHMVVQPEFLTGATRNSNYVLAAILSVGGRKVGILTVDTKEGFNILGTEVRLEDVVKANATASQKRTAAELQLMEKLLFCTVQYLNERILPDLFKEAA